MVFQNSLFLVMHFTFVKLLFGFSVEIKAGIQQAKLTNINKKI